MEKSDLCPEERLSEYARILKAAGHPIRLRLLCLIERQQDPCVSDMWKCLNQPQPVISQHLSILKKNGIVSAEIQKTRRVYSISNSFIRDLMRAIISNELNFPQSAEPGPVGSRPSRSAVPTVPPPGQFRAEPGPSRPATSTEMPPSAPTPRLQDRPTTPARDPGPESGLRSRTGRPRG